MMTATLISRTSTNYIANRNAMSPNAYAIDKELVDPHRSTLDYSHGKG
jgi:hypothetical protein